MSVTPQQIEDFIKKLTRDSEENRPRSMDNSPVFEEPLVAFATGDNPLFLEYKKIIDNSHLTPAEALEKATGTKPEKANIISWVLPIAEGPKASMRREKRLPSKMWAQALHHGPRFNDFLRKQLVDYLHKEGHAAVAPYIEPFFKRIVTETDQRSNWSERHIAYACGLGTFSISDNMITPKGVSMFCGSVATDLDVPQSPREYTSHVENCPFLVNGSCGRCIKRCPSGAITEKGHDKIRCFNYRYDELQYLNEPYGVPKVGCGLCLTAVPCESSIPKGLLRKS